MAYDGAGRGTPTTRSASIRQMSSPKSNLREYAGIKVRLAEIQSGN